MINFALAVFSLCKLHLQPCCHFLLDETPGKGARGAKSVPAAACVGKQALIGSTRLQLSFFFFFTSFLLSIELLQTRPSVWCSRKVFPTVKAAQVLPNKIFTCYYFPISESDFDGGIKGDYAAAVAAHFLVKPHLCQFLHHILHLNTKKTTTRAPRQRIK